MKRVAAVVLGVFLMVLSCGLPANAQTNTWDQFSGFGHRWAGQFWAITGDTDPHNQVGWRNQWGVEPQSGGTAPGAVSNIRWGSPDTWPNPSYERFERSDDGAWALLDGFGNSATGQFGRQRVTKEVVSDIDCKTNRQVLPLVEVDELGGKQHYARWDTPTHAPYCLQAWGVIEVPGGTNVNFYHRQGFWPQSGPWCSNTYFQNQVCVKQYEYWADDNPNNTNYGPSEVPGLMLIHSRDNILALNKGQAYIHHNYLANNGNGWRAEGRYFWSY